VAPKRKTLTARIQRKRRRVDFGYEREPQNRASINIPERFKTARHGINEVRFLFHDDEPQDEEDNEEDRIIIFATDMMLDELSRSDVWHIEGIAGSFLSVVHYSRCYSQFELRISMRVLLTSKQDTCNI